jgi:hypothetical protein
LDDEIFLLLDSRFNQSEPGVEFINAEQTRMILTGESSGGESMWQWAFERRYVLRVDGRPTPLATASPETLASFVRPQAKSFPISIRS